MSASESTHLVYFVVYLAITLLSLYGLGLFTLWWWRVGRQRHLGEVYFYLMLAFAGIAMTVGSAMVLRMPFLMEDVSPETLQKVYAVATSKGLIMRQVPLILFLLFINIRMTLRWWASHRLWVSSQAAIARAVGKNAVDTGCIRPVGIEGHSVMVVEDDENLRHIFTKILAAGGYRVCQAASGLEAIATKKIYPEIIVTLLDIRMPVMSGIDTSYHLSKMDKLMPIVAVTGYLEDHSGAEYVEAGFSDYICKPVTGEKLLETVAAQVARAERWRRNK